MSQATLSNTNRGLMGFLLVAVLVVLAWAVISNMPDNRSTADRIGDAATALPHGVDKAADQLRDRTPGERLGDSIRETTDNATR